MNKTIRRIAEDTGLLPDRKHPRPQTYFLKKKEKQLNEFAKRIIRECLHLCNTTIQDPIPKSHDSWEKGVTACMNEIEYLSKDEEC
jgi:hypothetical protein